MPQIPDNPALRLGRSETDEPVNLPSSALLRHLMALGSSGSGKTVLCKVTVEEAVRQDIPVICVDPQGDLASLALAADTERGAELAARADVVVFSPASRVAVPLCADPVGAIGDADPVHAYTRVAAMVASLLGYDLDSDDGAGLSAVFDSALADMATAGRSARSLADLSAYLADLDAASLQRYERLIDARKIRVACQRLARLDVGARRLMFHDGLPLDIDVLLGRSGSAGAVPGKTRVSVIYLNTLHNQEDKDFFIAALVDRLYQWMLSNPSKTPQLLFYIDEVAPFIPPVRKPACKEGLQLLFKQARKYGVCCLMATQNPGDVDYKAMAQFGTWALGRLTTRQDVKKIEPTLKALAPAHSDELLARLPALEPGRFVLLSPDSFDGPVDLRTRWLDTEHETLDEERIAELTDPVRERFVLTPDPKPDPLTRWEAVLCRKKTMSTKEFADRAKVGVNKARGLLKELVAADLAGTWKDGRTMRYWARSRGTRPDLGLGAQINALVPRVDRVAAAQAGKRLARSKLLGFIGDDERLSDLVLVYQPVFRLTFEETVQRGLLGRLFGPSHDLRLGNIYLHPCTLQVLVFHSDRGIRFADKPADLASEVADFDGSITFTERAPGELTLDEERWRDRRSSKEVRAHFKRRFEASPKSIENVFVPVWKLLLENAEGGDYRVQLIDALVGEPVQWP